MIIAASTALVLSASLVWGTNFALLYLGVLGRHAGRTAKWRDPKLAEEMARAEQDPTYGRGPVEFSRVGYVATASLVRHADRLVTIGLVLLPASLLGAVIWAIS